MFLWRRIPLPAASSSPLPAVGAFVSHLATSRAIGWHQETVKLSKKKQVTTSTSIEVQAWELGIILAGIAAYDYVEGGGSLFNFFQNHTPIPNSVSGAPPGQSCSEGMHWDPYIGKCVTTR
jgi:hypothetical protein